MRPMLGEKHSGKIPEGLVDQGWEQMAAILDREMPERKRRAFVWWLFAGLVFIVGAGAVGYNYLQSDKLEESSPELMAEGAIMSAQNKADIDELPVPVTSDEDSLKKTNEKTVPEAEVVSAKIANDPVLKEESRYIEQATSESAGQKSGLNILPELTLDRKTQEDLTSEGLDTREEGEDIIFVSNRNDAGEISKKELAIEDLRQTYEDINPLGLRGQNLLPFYIRKLDQAEKQMSEISSGQRESKFRIGAAVRGDLLTDYGFERLNPGGGLELHFGIGSRFRVVTGLSYWRLVSDRMIYASQSSLADEEVFYGNSIDMEDTDAVDGDNSFLLDGGNDARKFHILEIPVLAIYRIGSRWDAYLGVNWMNSIDRLRSEDQNLGLVSTPAFQTPTRVNLAQNRSLYRAKNFSYVAGARYGVARHFFVDLRFSVASDLHLNYDISDQSIGSKRSNLHSGIRLGVGYRFRTRVKR